jgi:serine/threonine protein kinase
MAGTGEDSRLVRQVYAGALQRDPEEREEYLDRACADRPELRAKVVALLDAHSADFLEPSVSSTPTRETAFPRRRPDHIDGEIVGPYILRRELGRGGMGVVYLADDSRLSRRVALKALNPALGGDPGGRERLRREARSAAVLTHPGIATVYAIEEIGDQLYMACEYVPGEPLRRLLASGPVPIGQVVEIGLQLARALAAAHTAGIVHRDIKPENIVRTPSGVIKVLDFGLARMEAAPYLTQSGVVLGTPGYLSPEQALGRTVDFRTDLFAAGLVLYELAAGVNPFAAPTITATLARIVEEDPEPLSRVQPATPPDLERIVDTCLQKDPEHRYASTQQLVSDLEELSADVAERRRTSSERRHRPYMARAAGPRWWWQFHQVVMSVVYVAMLYPAWLVRAWIPRPWHMVFFLVLLAATAAATSLRLHLWFMSRYFPAELPAQLSWSGRRTRWCDVVLSACQAIAAAVIAGAHPEFAVLLVTVATSTLVAAFVIEPVTARVAFPPAGLASSGSSGA